MGPALQVETIRLPQISPQGRTRRGFVLAALAAASVWGGGALWRSTEARRFAFEPDPHPAGFRRLSGGRVSTGTVDPLVGIGETQANASKPRDDELCDWLFVSGTGPGIPVAYFSDQACPYCRIVSAAVAQLAGEGLIVPSWHEYPIFGPGSELAARASHAAAKQVAHEAFHLRLMRSRFEPSETYLTDLAGTLDIDAEQLLSDMHSDAVEQRLVRTRGLAYHFGFAGTPALVVGRTIVHGAISKEQLRALVALEVKLEPGPCS